MMDGFLAATDGRTPAGEGLVATGTRFRTQKYSMWVFFGAGHAPTPFRGVAPGLPPLHHRMEYRQ